MNLDDMFNNSIASSKANAGKRGKQKSKGAQNQYAWDSGRNNSIRKSTPEDFSGQPSAAYNFVPLPLSPLLSEIDQNAGSDEERLANYRQHRQRKDLLSGLIELSIETKTPCYIRLNEADDSFFSPQGKGKEIIPGSTIRGMIKNLLKIVSAGTMRPSTNKTPDGDISDKYLYFRTMAAKAPIAKPYKDEMMGMERVNGKVHGVTKAKAGFLFHVASSNKYYIQETTSEKIKDLGLVKMSSVPNTPEAHNGNNGACVDWSDPKKVRCFTGEMQGKKHYTIHARPKKWTTLLPVSEETIQMYKSDTTRRGVNLFEIMLTGEDAKKFSGTSEIDEVVPCFFVAKNKKVRHFGFGQYYRIPYSSSIGEHIPQTLQSEGVDFADAIFGRKELWGSRVFFEDANIEKERGKTLSHEYSHPLTSPNPTSFQFYLNQTSNSLQDIKAWNDLSATIRGYKLYWHKDISDSAWKRDPDEDLKDQLKITPLAKGWRFKSKIRFTDLSPIELGALLKVFDLAVKDKNCCFKLGQGKALGMGSVRIEPVLKITPNKYYQELFTKDGLLDDETTEQPFDEYVTRFENYLTANFDPANLKAYQASLMELTTLLSWKNIDRKSTSMTVDRFKRREVLPAASKVERK